MRKVLISLALVGVLAGCSPQGTALGNCRRIVNAAFDENDLTVREALTMGQFNENSMLENARQSAVEAMDARDADAFESHFSYLIDLCLDVMDR